MPRGKVQTGMFLEYSMYYHCSVHTQCLVLLILLSWASLCLTSNCYMIYQTCLLRTTTLDRISLTWSLSYLTWEILGNIRKFVCVCVRVRVCVCAHARMYVCAFPRSVASVRCFRTATYSGHYDYNQDGMETTCLGNAIIVIFVTASQYVLLVCC